MKIDILGTEYTINVKSYDDDTFFRDHVAAGYCDDVLKIITLCDMATYPEFDNRPPEFLQEYQRRVMRHEIVHAFFAESGLDDSALTLECSWARNEEMVDWFALQGAKIYRAWQAAGAL